MLDKVASALEQSIIEGPRSRQAALLTRIEKCWPSIEQLVGQKRSAAEIARIMVEAGFEGSKPNIRDLIGERYAEAKRQAPRRKIKRGRRSVGEHPTILSDNPETDPVLLTASEKASEEPTPPIHNATQARSLNPKLHRDRGL